MWGYSRRLKRDLTRWREAGWVSSEAEASILADVAERGGLGLASSLGILASILLGFAVVSFVASHWADMPRGARLGLLIALIWAGYGTAGAFAARQASGFGDAAILFANAAFGTSIALISQMYHIDGHPPDGVLLWALGGFASGAVLKSNPSLVLSLILFSVWAAMETASSGKVQWSYLLTWSAVAAAFAWQRWAPGAHLAGLALAGFMITLGYVLNDGHAHGLPAGIGLVAAALAIGIARQWPTMEPVAAPALGHAIATAFAGLFALQFIETIPAARLILLGALTLMLLIGAIAYGLLAGHRGALWLGYIGFSIEILALYVKTVGTLRDTSLFFLIAALMVAGLAFLATRLVHWSRSLGAPS